MVRPRKEEGNGGSPFTDGTGTTVDSLPPKVTLLPPIRMRTPSLLASVLLVTQACAAPTPAGIIDPSGQWEKRESTLPPVSLTIQREGSEMSATLRLSGIEDRGRVTLDGRSGLTVTFSSGRPPLTGRLESADRMTVRFSDSHSEVLRRRP